MSITNALRVVAVVAVVGASAFYVNRKYRQAKAAMKNVLDTAVVAAVTNEIEAIQLPEGENVFFTKEVVETYVTERVNILKHVAGIPGVAKLIGDTIDTITSITLDGKIDKDLYHWAIDHIYANC